MSRPLVLVIDAVPAHIRGLHDILGGTCRVSFATSAERGYQLAREQLPDLVVLAVDLPVLDGLALARRLRSEALTAHIPFLLTAPRDSAHDTAEGLSVGASDYVYHPFDPALVKARVQTHLRIKQAAERMARQAGIDGLTHLATRRVFDRTLTRAWKRAWRTGAPIGLVVLEVDHFEAYVQLYGRAAGDQCLRECALALDRVALRPDDLLARYGQRTFALLLPDTPPHGTRCLALACGAAIRALSLPHPASPTAATVSVSVGAASEVPDSADAHGLLSAATSALANAIAAGRDQVGGGAPSGRHDEGGAA